MGNEQGKPSEAELKNREIQKMDHEMRRKFGRGVQYNMKIVIKGERNTGKSCLLKRLQGQPFTEEYIPTAQIQTAHIHWNYKATDDLVKVEVWDVVDEAKRKKSGGGLKTAEDDFDEEDDISVGPAEIYAQQAQTGSHAFTQLDARFIDVYKGSNGVIFMYDMTKKWTLDYVKREIENVPEGIDILVLANFRDLGDRRVVTESDAKAVLQSLGRDIKYLECSLQNQFGLNALYTYLNLPFLKLKRRMIEQQLRVIDEDYDAAAHEIKVITSSQNYDSYLQLIKETRKKRSVFSPPTPMAPLQGAPSNPTTTDHPSPTFTTPARTSASQPLPPPTSARSPPAVQQHQLGASQPLPQQSSTQTAALPSKPTQQTVSPQQQQQQAPAPTATRQTSVPSALNKIKNETISPTRSGSLLSKVFGGLSRAAVQVQGVATGKTGGTSPKVVSQQQPVEEQPAPKSVEEFVPGKLDEGFFDDVDAPTTAKGKATTKPPSSTSSSLDQKGTTKPKPAATIKAAAVGDSSEEEGGASRPMADHDLSEEEDFYGPSTKSKAKPSKPKKEKEEKATSKKTKESKKAAKVQSSSSDSEEGPNPLVTKEDDFSDDMYAMTSKKKGSSAKSSKKESLPAKKEKKSSKSKKSHGHSSDSDQQAAPVKVPQYSVEPSEDSHVSKKKDKSTKKSSTHDSDHIQPIDTPPAAIAPQFSDFQLSFVPSAQPFIPSIPLTPTPPAVPVQPHVDFAPSVPEFESTESFYSEQPTTSSKPKQAATKPQTKESVSESESSDGGATKKKKKSKLAKVVEDFEEDFYAKSSSKPKPKKQESKKSTKTGQISPPQKSPSPLPPSISEQQQQPLFTPPPVEFVPSLPTPILQTPPHASPPTAKSPSPLFEQPQARSEDEEDSENEKLAPPAVTVAATSTPPTTATTSMHQESLLNEFVPQELDASPESFYSETTTATEPTKPQTKSPELAESNSESDSDGGVQQKKKKKSKLAKVVEDFEEDYVKPKPKSKKPEPPKKSPKPEPEQSSPPPKPPSPPAPEIQPVFTPPPVEFVPPSSPPKEPETVVAVPKDISPAPKLKKPVVVSSESEEESNPSDVPARVPISDGNQALNDFHVGDIDDGFFSEEDEEKTNQSEQDSEDTSSEEISESDA